MSRRKKTSKLIETANTRLAALRSISPDLDLGNGVSVGTFAAKIESVSETLRDYNTALSSIDELYHAFTVGEDELADLHERVLLSVASRYGKNSIEYEKAGGTRKSVRRRRSGKTPSQPAA